MPIVLREYGGSNKIHIYTLRKAAGGMNSTKTESIVTLDIIVWV